VQPLLQPLLLLLPLLQLLLLLLLWQRTQCCVSPQWYG
jgi:hypothetical protein